VFGCGPDEATGYYYPLKAVASSSSTEDILVVRFHYVVVHRCYLNDASDYEK